MTKLQRELVGIQSLNPQSGELWRGADPDDMGLAKAKAQEVGT